MTEARSYTVGQVLYIVPKGKTAVYPMIVVEEITKRTLQGEERTYVLQGGGEGENRINLDEVVGDVFITLDELRQTLTQRMQRYLDKVIEAANAQAHSWFRRGNQEQQRQPAPPDEAHRAAQPREEAEDAPVVDLGNGMIARIKLPDALRA